MARYLLIADHTGEGPALLDAGGTARRDLLRRTAEDLGGEVLSFDCAADVVFVLAELPGHGAAARAALTLRSTPAGGVQIVQLMTPEEVDVAAQLV
jgi:uncharacterized protein with GYD domain